MRMELLRAWEASAIISVLRCKVEGGRLWCIVWTCIGWRRANDTRHSRKLIYGCPFKSLGASGKGTRKWARRWRACESCDVALEG